MDKGPLQLVSCILFFYHSLVAYSQPDVYHILNFVNLVLRSQVKWLH